MRTDDYEVFGESAAREVLPVSLPELILESGTNELIELTILLDD